MSNVQKERLGVAAVEKEIAAAGWFFREQPLPDEGIDAQIEGADRDGRPNGRLLGVQIKSGGSYFKGGTRGGWRYSIKRNNLIYWGKYSLPVILVLYDPDRDQAFWQVVRTEHLERTADGGITIFIPEGQIIDESALPAFDKLANEGLPKDAAALALVVDQRRAELDIGWIERLESGDRLFVEAEEWVNKSSGRGSLRLVVEDGYGIERIEREWPWVFLPGVTYAEELPKLFPWADLELDVRRFRENAYADFVNECGVWDSEAGEYMLMEDFDGWVERRLAGGLQPYAEDVSGEVVLWRLEFKLNDLGRATLAHEHDVDYWESLLKIDAEEREAEAVHDGYYEGQYGDAPIGRTVERVLFVSGDDADIIAGGEILWTEDGPRPDLARGILTHALQREPTRAQAVAFVARFKDVLDDVEGHGWIITYTEIQQWLRELGVHG